ncbi:MAG: VWA domain-containing protein [Spirochaetales bacterium]|nr:VWA domain-containing protein [Spirochaetales bacterium]
MVIDKPEYLWLFLVLAPVVLLSYYNYRNGKKDLQELAGTWRFESLFPIYQVKQFFILFFFLLFLVFTFLALADIKWGQRFVPDDREGYEIVISLDVSQSMLADDINPSRLKAAKRIIQRLIDRMKDAKFGVVIFKGEAVRIWPVTDDFQAITLFLETAGPDLITTSGSNIERGITCSLNTFHEAGKYRAIILFTDGENLHGDPLPEAKKAGARGIPVIPVVCGTEKGARIFRNDGSAVRDRNGERVVSTINRTLLEHIAALSGGKLFEIYNAERIPFELLSIVTDIEDENLDKGLKLVKNEGYRLFLFLGMLFLLLSLITRGIRWKDII